MISLQKCQAAYLDFAVFILIARKKMDKANAN